MRDPITILDRLGRTLAHEAGVRVEVGGDQAFTDGRIVRLPALPETSLTEQQWRITNGLLNHEAGHVLHTTFDALPADPLLAQVLNTLEDPRVEHRFVGRYPGAAADLHIAHESALADIAAKADRLEPYQRRLLALICRLDGLAAPIELGADALQWSQRWATIRPAVLDASTTTDLLPLAERIRAELFGAPRPEAPQPQPQPPMGDSTGAGAGPATGPDAGADSSASATGPSGAGTDDGSIPAPAGPVERESLLSLAMRGQVNSLAQQPGYRPQPIRGPRLLDHGDGRALDDLARRTVPGLARRLAHAVQAETQSRWLPDQERGRLDPRRLHRLIHGTGTRLFRRLERGREVDTAATLIVDASSSMGYSLTTAAAAITTVVQALDRVRVATEVLAFGGPRLAIAKAFDEAASITTSRLAILRARGGTPLGEVLLAAVKRLIHQPAERHLVFVATDGQPDHIDYCADVLRRCERVGVEAIGIGIGVDVTKVFRRSLTIAAIDQLAPALLGQVRSVLLTSTSSRRLPCR